MTDEPAPTTYHSFLGTGWSFPPAFSNGAVAMVSDEVDIRQSLEILFRTAPGERLFQPKYGLDMSALLFEPMSTTMRTFVADLVRTSILIYEPRIKVTRVGIDSPDPNDGSLLLSLEYEIRATNSRYNLVFPFYRSDGNELRSAIDAGATSSTSSD